MHIGSSARRGRQLQSRNSSTRQRTTEPPRRRVVPPRCAALLRPLSHLISIFAFTFAVQTEYLACTPVCCGRMAHARSPCRAHVPHVTLHAARRTRARQLRAIADAGGSDASLELRIELASSLSALSASEWCGERALLAVASKSRKPPLTPGTSVRPAQAPAAVTRSSATAF